MSRSHVRIRPRTTVRAAATTGLAALADAKAVYDAVRPGDPFEITGADAKGTIAPNNGYGEWNPNWAEWQAKSALR
ncbi:hypothetical protein [Streptomyces sp. NPDC001970]